MRRAHSSPTTWNGQEDFGSFLDKSCLLLRGEHQVSKAFALRGERGKDSAADTKVR